MPRESNLPEFIQLVEGTAKSFGSNLTTKLRHLPLAGTYDGAFHSQIQWPSPGG